MTGVALVVLACVAIGVASSIGGEAVSIPGLVSIRVYRFNDAPALDLLPNFGGMLVTIVVITLLSAIAAIVRPRRHSQSVTTS